MTPEDQKYFETYMDLFAHPGWSQFITDMTETANQINSVADISSESELHNRKGKLEVLFAMINLSDMKELQFRQALEDEQDEEAV